MTQLQVVRQETSMAEALQGEQLQLLKDTIAKGASDAEFALFVQVCKRLNLDPFARQIYLIRRSGQMQAMTSIDGFRVVAERTGRYEGQTAPMWCGEDGEWTDVWLSKKPPAAAKVGVWKTGCREPIYAVARYDSYAQPSSPTWKKMPDVMVAKCAESLALRKAFPNDLSGIYTTEEMDQAQQEPIDVTPFNYQEADETLQCFNSSVADMQAEFAATYKTKTFDAMPKDKQQAFFDYFLRKAEHAFAGVEPDREPG